MVRHPCCGCSAQYIFNNNAGNADAACFGRNAIINTKFIADWDYIRQRKQNIIHNNNERENAKKIPHTYQIGDKIKLKKYNQHKYGGPEYEGPYAIAMVNDNGTVRIQRRKFYDVVNIRNIKPYYQ